MSADDQTSGERWLDMTNAAYDKVTGFLLQVAEPERQAMWIEVTGTSANQWTCSISLKPLDAAAPHDAIVRHRDLAIVVPERDFDKVRGATIDWLDEPFGTSGLRVDNPNSGRPVTAPNRSGDTGGRVVATNARDARSWSETSGPTSDRWAHRSRCESVLPSSRRPPGGRRR